MQYLSMFRRDKDKTVTPLSLETENFEQTPPGFLFPNIR